MALTPSRRLLAGGIEVWRVQYRIPPATTPTSETFDTVEDALAFIALIERVGPAAARKIRIASTLADEERLVTCAMAFAAYQKHVSSYAERGTVRKYASQWRLYCAEHFDDWPIDQVPREIVEDWIADLREKETQPSIRAREQAEAAGKPLPPRDFLSAKTIANVQGLLSSVFQLQVDRNNLMVNPAKGAPLPDKRQKRRPVFLTFQQRETLVAAVTEVVSGREDAEKWVLMIEWELATGPRWGEVTALLPGDFDLEAPIPKVTISRAWKYFGGSNWGLTKSEAGDRVVSFPERFREPLRKLMRGSDDFVFSGTRGGRLYDATFHRYIWQPALRRAGINPRPRFHDLRHTHVSMLIEQGVPLPYIQQRIGHENISTTIKVYGHLSPAVHEVTAQATEAAIVGPQVEAGASSVGMTGTTLAAMREALGESIEEFAPRIGVTALQLAFLEATGVPLPAEIVEKLGRALGSGSPLEIGA